MMGIFYEDAFMTVLNMSVTASYVALAVLAARFLLRKAPKLFSYALWSIVLFRLICPVSFSSGFSLLGLIGSNHVDNTFSAAQYIPRKIGLMAVPQVNTGIDSVNAGINAVLPAATPYASVNPMQVWISLAGLVWLTGIVVLLGYAIFSYQRLLSRISTATWVEDNIYETDLIQTPFVCGFIKPRIYLPLRITGREREYIIRHEQVHIKRLDYIIKPLAYFALVIHWFNPLIWVCFSLFTKDMEMSCDERVVERAENGEVISYSSSLLALAAQKKMPRPTPLAFGESNVKARIKNILNYRKPSFWALSVSAIALLILVVVLISNPLSRQNTSDLQAAASSYNVEYLLNNKTPYVGNNSKVGALLNGLPLPEGITRGSFVLSTDNPPYGLTSYYDLEDDALEVSEDQFLRNSILLFALIDNLDQVTHTGFWHNKLLSSTPFQFSYTRADAERVAGGDVRQFAKDQRSLEELIEVVKLLGSDTTQAQATMKGLELYVWRNPELTGSNAIYYTLLQGTNRNKTAEEIYDLTAATTSIEDIRRELAKYGTIDVLVSHPLEISKQEMMEIVDQMKVKNGSIAAGVRWFEQNPLSEKTRVISPIAELRHLTEKEYLEVGTSEIENPSIDDFRRLDLTLKVQGLDDRKLSFPEDRQITDVLTPEVHWFSSSFSQDNSSENFAHYSAEIVVYIREIGENGLRDRLKNLNIDVAYTNQQGERVEQSYNLGDILVVIE
ncbi:M56 family metallopeptidase [Desulfosporosinus youngiae]|nr:M56 family metallopeptidase [Desulfosporosinus youngiae]